MRKEQQGLLQNPVNCKQSTPWRARSCWVSHQGGQTVWFLGRASVPVPTTTTVYATYAGGAAPPPPLLHRH